jgi:hypothetical protein
VEIFQTRAVYACREGEGELVGLRLSAAQEVLWAAVVIPSVEKRIAGLLTRSGFIFQKELVNVPRCFIKLFENTLEVDVIQCFFHAHLKKDQCGGSEPWLLTVRISVKHLPSLLYYT